MSNTALKNTACLEAGDGIQIEDGKIRVDKDFVSSAVPFYLPLHFSGSESGEAQSVYSAIPAGKNTVSVDFIGADMEKAIGASPVADLSLAFSEIGAVDTGNEVRLLMGGVDNLASCAALAGKAVRITLGDSVGLLLGSGTVMLKFS